jgi:hypothetical protein
LLSVRAVRWAVLIAAIITGGAHRDVTRLLLTTERPVYLALLIFAGAAWSPGSRDLLFIAPAFVLIRLASRLAGGWFAGARVAPPELRTPRLGRALLAQGGIAVALAINYTQVRPDLNGDLILTTTLVSVLLFEIVASREAGELAAGAPVDESTDQKEPSPELLPR